EHESTRNSSCFEVLNYSRLSLRDSSIESSVALIGETRRVQKGQAAGLVFFLVIVKKRDFGRLAVYNQRNQDKSMNLKRIIWTSCFAAVVLTASFALGQPHRGGGSMGMRGGQTFSHGGMGTWGGRNWNGGNWSGRNGGNWSGRNGGNWSGRNWSGGNWSGNWRHHHHHGGSDFIFIGDFGFPFCGWG